MKAIRRFAQVQVLLLSLLSSTVVPTAVHADEVRGAFTLTSETHWGKLLLPAGYYTYSLATNTAMPVILIRSANGNLAGFVGAISETDTTDKDRSALTIETKGNLSVITALHINDAGVILHYGVPADAIETAAKAPDSTLTASIGKK
jgi:hypothetical protein